MRSPGSYEADGASYSFSEFAQLIGRRGAKTVLVQETKSVQDVICLSMLGLESNSSVFFSSEGGAPRSVSWEMDAVSTGNVMQGCRG
jgi:hypothetical protein